MDIRLAQLNPTIGDISGNCSLITDALLKAENDSVDLLMVPELAVCGYAPYDLLERTDFLNAIYGANAKLAERAGETALLFGTVTASEETSGRTCYNSAILAHNGRQIAEIHKALLPTYDVYNELRYFEAGKEFDCVEFRGQKLGITVCEDIWHNFENRYVSYDTNPVAELTAQGADAILNISGSLYSHNKPEQRCRMLQSQAQRYNLPVFYVNQVGGNAELVSDGDSMAINADAKVVGRAPLFKDGTVDLSWNPENSTVQCAQDPARVPTIIEQKFEALKLGLQDYLQKTGAADKVVIGLSGGIDSALVAAIAVAALGADQVLGITMPTEFSSEGSITDSQQLADNLGVRCLEMPIEELYDQFISTLSPLFGDTSFGTAEENIQPRIRGTLLMAYSNKFGNLLLNPSNKSELATGYSTLYGDMAGALGVIADLYKQEVYEMARWLNEFYFDKEVIPQNILQKPPSAELRPNQKDEDSLPDYETLDAVLKMYIEDQYSADEIIEQGFEASTVKQIITLVNQMEFKRYQAVPVLKVSNKTFGAGRKVPLVHRWSPDLG